LALKEIAKSSAFLVGVYRRVGYMSTIRDRSGRAGREASSHFIGNHKYQWKRSNHANELCELGSPAGR
jgi:hypothetical protein